MSEEITHGDFMDNALPDGWASLIIADPPYYRVKGGFDFVWGSFDDYLADVGGWAGECDRLLADNGTLLWWGHAKTIAYTQVILDTRLTLKNSLVWRKTECRTLKNDMSRMETFPAVTERLLMYAREGSGETSLDRVLADPTLFLPVKRYLDEGLEASGLTLKQAVSRFGSTASHWFGFSRRPKKQFEIPTGEKYALLVEQGGWSKPYDELRREFEDLRSSYETLRRPFDNAGKLTDVLEFSQQSHITARYDHPTQKPEALTAELVRCCSRRGGNVLVPFAGSGTEAAVSAGVGRVVAGFETNRAHVETARRRVADALVRQHTLFD